MKANIHPNYQEIKVRCGCGNEFTTGSTRKDDLSLEVCNQCHPFYTGKQKVIDTGGRVGRFERRFASYAKKGEAQNDSKDEAKS